MPVNKDIKKENKTMPGRVSSNDADRELDRKIDVVFEAIGGFGKHQSFVVISMVSFLSSIAMFCGNLSYLEMVPREYYCTYEGSDEAKLC